MKPSILLVLAVVVAAAALAGSAQSARADTCKTGCATLLTTIANMRHEMLKTVANNLRA